MVLESRDSLKRWRKPVRSLFRKLEDLEFKVIFSFKKKKETKKGNQAVFGLEWTDVLAIGCICAWAN